MTQSGSNLGTPRKWREGTRHPVCPAVRWLAWLCSITLCHELFSRDRTVALIQFARKVQTSRKSGLSDRMPNGKSDFDSVYGTVVAS